MADGIDKSIPRGIRNNNPGNIKKNNIEWDGLAEEQIDPIFFIFKEPIWGIRALMRILLVYRFKHKLKTPHDIIYRWAPPSENPTDTYIEHISKYTGYKADQELDNTIEDYLPLVKALIMFENGKQPYNDETLVEGMFRGWDGFPTNE